MKPSHGPVRSRLEDLWQRYASPTRRLFSRNIFRELRLRARFDIDPVDLKRITNDVPRGAVPDCPSCPNVCCGGYENVISLRLIDIADLIDLERTDLISTKKPRFPEELLAERPWLQDLSTSFLWRTLPIIRQEGPGRRCAALTKNLRCSLYPNWPTSCERFPYTFHPLTQRVRWGSRCPTRRSGVDLKRSHALYQAALSTYNERIRDAVLLYHGRQALDELGIGQWLTSATDDAFEAPELLPILRS